MCVNEKPGFPQSYSLKNAMLSERQDPIVVENEEAAAARTLPTRHPAHDDGPSWEGRPEESMDELWQQGISSGGRKQPCRHCHHLFCSVASGGGVTTSSLRWLKPSPGTCLIRPCREASSPLPAEKRLNLLALITSHTMCQSNGFKKSTHP